MNLEFILTYIDAPKYVKAQIELQFKINFKETEDVLVYLPNLKKHLSVKVAGSKRLRYNLFQAVIPLLGDAPEWGEISKTWQNLAAIVEIYLNLSQDQDKSVTPFFRIDYGVVIKLALVIGECIDDDFPSQGPIEDPISTFLEGLHIDKRRASRETIFVIALIFNINILAIDATNGVELIKPWVTGRTKRIEARRTICIFHEKVIERDQVHHYYRLVKGLN